MIRIEVAIEPRDDGWEADVQVHEDRGSTRHRIRLPLADYQRLTGGKIAPEELVRRSFVFLLEREPKESILRSFELSVIARYFPEYEREIRGSIGS
ncbi:MAG TPA: hypothetical protein VI893_05100 [Thermoplasmata archaeon]|nr:hypothetical protein [Thermoplasmata archaeon]